jgi:outer membrane putative beta-barrel porin/alpha-amylase
MNLPDRPAAPGHRDRLVAVGLLVACALLPSVARAQGNFEIQVYPSETVTPGTTMVELHSNVAARGTTGRENGVLPTQGAFHETLEITQGWTSWFETGFYLFTSIQPDSGWEWVGDHIRPRVRAPESWHLPVGLSLSTEIGYQRRRFSEDTWTREIRPIIDKQWGPWYVSFNPVFGRAIKGENTGSGFEFSPSLKIGYDVTPKVSVGIEYYGTVGPVTRFDPWKEQQHQIFPVVDLNLSPKWEFNFGVGVGLTPSTDRLIVKMILGYRFDWGSGERR